MIILVIVVLLWTPVLLIVARGRRLHIPPMAGTRVAHPQPAHDEISPAADPGGPSWSPLDDHQLTRLLTDAAPRTITE